MLGPPEQRGHFSGWDIGYRLGQERGLIGIDSEWLVMRLDDNRRVEDVRVVTD